MTQILLYHCPIFPSPIIISNKSLYEGLLLIIIREGKLDISISRMLLQPYDITEKFNVVTELLLGENKNRKDV